MRLHLLLVTFSLRNPNKDYTEFFVALRGNAINWWHFIEQTAIVTTRMDAFQYAEVLHKHIEATDSLFVTEIDSKTSQGWLPRVAWEWLQSASQQIENEKLIALLPGFLPPQPGK